MDRLPAPCAPDLGHLPAPVAPVPYALFTIEEQRHELLPCDPEPSLNVPAMYRPPRLLPSPFNPVRLPVSDRLTTPYAFLVSELRTVTTTAAFASHPKQQVYRPPSHSTSGWMAYQGLPRGWHGPVARLDASHDTRLLTSSYRRALLAVHQFDAFSDRTAAKHASRLLARVTATLDDSVEMLAAGFAPTTSTSGEAGIVQTAQAGRHLAALCLVRTGDHERALALQGIARRAEHVPVVLVEDRAAEAHERPTDEQPGPTAAVEHSFPRETRAGPARSDDDDEPSHDEETGAA